MNLKRFGLICIAVGVIGEALAARAWWYISTYGSVLFNEYLPPQIIADILDEAGAVIWLGIALLIVAYAEARGE